MATETPALTLAEWHYLWHALDFYAFEYGRPSPYEPVKRWLLANRPTNTPREQPRLPVDNKSD